MDDFLDSIYTFISDVGGSLTGDRDSTYAAEVGAAVAGAVVGAALGAVTSAISGGNILNGVLIGGGVGAGTGLIGGMVVKNTAPGEMVDMPDTSTRTSFDQSRPGDDRPNLGKYNYTNGSVSSNNTGVPAALINVAGGMISGYANGQAAAQANDKKIQADQDLQAQRIKAEQDAAALTVQNKRVTVAPTGTPAGGKFQPVQTTAPVTGLQADSAAPQATGQAAAAQTTGQAAKPQTTTLTPAQSGTAYYRPDVTNATTTNLKV